MVVQHNMQIRGLDQASTNAQDGVSAVQTAEGALTEVHSMLQRMNELSVQASNGTNSQTDRDAIQSEIEQLTTEIDRVAETTKFNETYLLKGGNGTAQNVNLSAKDAGLEGTWADVANEPNKKTFTIAELQENDKITIGGTEYTIIADNGTETDTAIKAAKAYEKIKTELKAANDAGATTPSNVEQADNVFTLTLAQGKSQSLSFNLHVGSDADMTNKINVDIERMDASYLGIKGLNVSDDSGKAATYAIDAISDALQKVSDQRSSLGAIQNRLEHTIDNLDNVVENTTSAESRIRDTDMADEMVKYSKNNILQQAGQSMLAQANQSTQGVLSLLQ